MGTARYIDGNPEPIYAWLLLIAMLIIFIIIFVVM